MPVCGAIIMLAAAEAIVSHGAGLAVVIVALPVAAYLVGRRQSRLSATRPAVQRDNPARAELARLRADVAELEDAAGRPLDAILAS